MPVIDIIFRVDEICKKYDKYDVDKHREIGTSGDDAFSRLFTFIDSDIEAVLRKAELASTEKNRAAAVAMNAEVRRTKARLAEDVVKLQKLAVKKIKGLTREERESRCDLVIALADRLQAIPDGNEHGAKQANNDWGGASAPNKNIKFDMSEEDMDDGFFQQTEESSQFRQEYEMRRKKQDEGLDVISEGLDALKNLARDMNEELDKQVPLMEEMETKVDGATSDLKNTNVRLKKQLVQMRSSRNFCIDIVLLCVILGIVSYIYNALN
ncbi:Target SNARE coiled-coil homology domain [Arabidopsis suecica]|uniref:Target SNARE coiled-coil homology domain n=1 Tax=Arabidopsis suecica TaxID=45249 RepID=A0A8T1ZUN1_ARASU|nr:Target SNARE coiled-coil homology domain [Arabidopsis suecica]